MQDVRELLRRHDAGQGGRQIARELGVDPKTVAPYLEAAQKLEPAVATLTGEIAGAVGGGERDGARAQSRLPRLHRSPQRLRRQRDRPFGAADCCKPVSKVSLTS